MPREIVTLQIGQCGNQLGIECWNRLLAEHGLAAYNERAEPAPADYDRKDIMFYESDSGDWIARSILLDLEPRVINSVRNSENGRAFSPESVWMSAGGGGAGNIWASGYSQAHDASETILEMIDREVELCDSMEAFQFLHSMAGGTGSGMGSYLLETLRERYPKKIMLSYSVLPLLDRSLSDVVVQPYNAVLTLARLIENCDGCVMLENTALNRLATEKQRLERPSFAHTNYLVATAMATMTSSLRFPTYTNNSLTSILANVVTVPSMHFLVPSIAPLDGERPVVAKQMTTVSRAAVVKKTSVLDILRRTLALNNFMVNLPSNAGDFLSTMCFIRGTPAPNEITEALERLRPQQQSRLISNLSITKPSRLLQTNRLSGLVVAQHSGIGQILRSCTKQFDLLLKRQAFLDNYRKEAMFSKDLGEFENARELVEGLIESYEALI